MLEDSNRLLCAAACFSTSLLHWLSTLARFCVFRPSHVVYVFAPRSSTHHYKAEHFGVFVFNINIPTTWPDCELPTNCVWLNSSVGLGRAFYTTCDSQAEQSANSTKRKYNTLTSHQSFQIRHLVTSCCNFEFYADFEKFYLPLLSFMIIEQYRIESRIFAQIEGIQHLVVAYSCSTGVVIQFYGHK